MPHGGHGHGQGHAEKELSESEKEDGHGHGHEEKKEEGHGHEEKKDDGHGHGGDGHGHGLEDDESITIPNPRKKPINLGKKMKKDVDFRNKYQHYVLGAYKKRDGKIA